MSIKVSATLRLWGVADTLSGGLRLVFGSFVDTKEQFYLFSSLIGNVSRARNALGYVCLILPQSAMASSAVAH